VAKTAQKVRGKFADEKYTGPELVLTADSTFTDEAAVFNWYNYYFSNEDAKGFALAYLKSIKFDKTKLKTLGSVDAPKLRTIGWLCRSLAQGGSLSPKLDAKLWSSIDQLVVQTVTPAVTLVDNEAEVCDSEQTEERVVSIRDRVNAKADNLIADIEDLLDQYYIGGKTFDAIKWFREKDVKSPIAQKIADYYKPLYSEIFDALQGKDDQLVEAYARWKKPKLKAYLEFIKTIIAAAEQRTVIAKAIRKPRKKKEKPASVVVAKLQYLEEDKELGVKSIKPVEVVGAQQLWVYNSKYRTIAVYNAMGPAGLSVKGTTLLGFDEKTSIVKKLRKPKEQLHALSASGKVQLRKYMDSIRCKPKEATGRINRDTILVRVGK
jgi:hypothetical protein